MDHRVAILSDNVQIVKLTSLPSPSVAAEIDKILCSSEDTTSCFHDEHVRGGAERPTIASMLKRGEVFVLAGLGRVLGVVGVSMSGQQMLAFLHTLCIAHDMRGKKYGDMLLKHVLRLYPGVELTVWRRGRDYKRLLRFYRRHHFQSVSDTTALSSYHVMRRLTA